MVSFFETVRKPNDLSKRTSFFERVHLSYVLFLDRAWEALKSCMRCKSLVLIFQ